MSSCLEEAWNHLFRRSLPLPWSIRMKIALGAAKGLAFLHEEAERPMIHRDFKTSNILLDAVCEGDKTHMPTRVMGTYDYAAPEYVMTGKSIICGSFVIHELFLHT